MTPDHTLEVKRKAITRGGGGWIALILKSM
jgi:hypothetical protein